MTRGHYTYDHEVVTSRWRLALASFRFLWRARARLYLTAPWCVATLADWTHCDACRGTVLALRAIEEGR